MQQPSQWPDQLFPSEEESTVEIKSVVLHLSDQYPHSLYNLTGRFSFWEKTIRVVAYILKFITLVKKSLSRNRISDRSLNRQHKSQSDQHFTGQELSEAKVVLYRLLQQQMFYLELKDLKKGNPVSSKSQLHSLSPFLDDQGLIRVGGRLEESDLTFEEKHPVILSKHPLVTVLIRYIHNKCLHGGMKLTSSTIRQQVWLINPRPQIKSVLFNCLPCTKIRASLASQLMANLPHLRITEQKRAFIHCGLDYAGPLQVRLAGGRGHKSQSCYIALFICLTVKAIHLEMVLDYSSATFIAAYKRFCSRRGIPTHIYSDNGTTFQGASRTLRDDFARVVDGSEFQNLLAEDKVTWHFIPPAAPHFGGIWEAGVKSVKTHLRRILLGKTPTSEELSTLLCQVEAVLNSRTNAPYTDSVDDLSPLTPGHFLIGGPINAVPQVSILSLKENRLTRWQLMQQMFEKFWKCWSTDYLQSLQQRTKWRISDIAIKTGHMVLLRKPNLPPTKWNLARVIECFPGPDGLVRVVKLKTTDSEYVRPITELVLLPIDLNSEEN